MRRGMHLLKSFSSFFLILLLCSGLINIVGCNSDDDPVSSYLSGGDSGDDCNDNGDGDDCNDDAARDASGTSYSGLTTPATIDENNAEDLLISTFEGGQIGSLTRIAGIQNKETARSGDPRTIKLAIMMRNCLRIVDQQSGLKATAYSYSYDMERTIAGDEGGSASYEIRVDITTGEFSGTLEFNEYCNDGFTMSGDCDFSGAYNQITEEMNQFRFSFDELDVTEGTMSLTMEGAIAWEVDNSQATMNINVVVTDNECGLTYKLKDFQIIFTEGDDYIQFEGPGRFYDPEYGYVTASMPEPFVIYYSDNGPSEGILLIQGDNSMAKLVTLTTETYQIQVDSDGDGEIDWTSEILYWDDI